MFVKLLLGENEQGKIEKLKSSLIKICKAEEPPEKLHEIFDKISALQPWQQMKILQLGFGAAKQNTSILEKILSLNPKLSAEMLLKLLKKLPLNNLANFLRGTNYKKENVLMLFVKFCPEREIDELVKIICSQSTEVQQAIFRQINEKKKNALMVSIEYTFDNGALILLNAIEKLKEPLLLKQIDGDDNNSLMLSIYYQRENLVQAHLNILKNMSEEDQFYIFEQCNDNSQNLFMLPTFCSLPILTPLIEFVCCWSESSQLLFFQKIITPIKQEQFIKAVWQQPAALISLSRLIENLRGKVRKSFVDKTLEYAGKLNSKIIDEQIFIREIFKIMPRLSTDWQKNILSLVRVDNKNLIMLALQYDIPSISFLLKISKNLSISESLSLLEKTAQVIFEDAENFASETLNDLIELILKFPSTIKGDFLDKILIADWYNIIALFSKSNDIKSHSLIINAILTLKKQNQIKLLQYMGSTNFQYLIMAAWLENSTAILFNELIIQLCQENRQDLVLQFCEFGFEKLIAVIEDKSSELDSLLYVFLENMPEFFAEKAKNFDNRQWDIFIQKSWQSSILAPRLFSLFKHIDSKLIKRFEQVGTTLIQNALQQNEEVVLETYRIVIGLPFEQQINILNLLKIEKITNIMNGFVWREPELVKNFYFMLENLLEIYNEDTVLDEFIHYGTARLILAIENKKDKRSLEKLFELLRAIQNLPLQIQKMLLDKINKNDEYWASMIFELKSQRLILQWLIGIIPELSLTTQLSICNGNVLSQLVGFQHDDLFLKILTYIQKWTEDKQDEVMQSFLLQCAKPALILDEQLVVLLHRLSQDARIAVLQKNNIYDESLLQSVITMSSHLLPDILSMIKKLPVENQFSIFSLETACKISDYDDSNNKEVILDDNNKLSLLFLAISYAPQIVPAMLDIISGFSSSQQRQVFFNVYTMNYCKPSFANKICKYIDSFVENIWNDLPLFSALQEVIAKLDCEIQKQLMGALQRSFINYLKTNISEGVPNKAKNFLEMLDQVPDKIQSGVMRELEKNANKLFADMVAKEEFNTVSNFLEFVVELPADSQRKIVLLRENKEKTNTLIALKKTPEIFYNMLQLIHAYILHELNVQKNSDVSEGESHKKYSTLKYLRKIEMGHWNILINAFKDRAMIITLMCELILYFPKNELMTLLLTCEVDNLNILLSTVNICKSVLGKQLLETFAKLEAHTLKELLTTGKLLEKAIEKYPANVPYWVYLAYTLSENYPKVLFNTYLPSKYNNIAYLINKQLELSWLCALVNNEIDKAIQKILQFSTYAAPVLLGMLFLKIITRLNEKKVTERNESRKQLYLNELLGLARLIKNHELLSANDNTKIGLYLAIQLNDEDLALPFLLHGDESAKKYAICLINNKVKNLKPEREVNGNQFSDLGCVNNPSPGLYVVSEPKQNAGATAVPANNQNEAGRQLRYNSMGNVVSIVNHQNSIFRHEEEEDTSKNKNCIFNNYSCG